MWLLTCYNMRTHFEAAKVSFNQSIQYRFGMLMSIFFSVFTVGVNYVIWSMVYSPGDMYGGYSFENSIVHAMLTGVMFSFMWDNWDETLSNYIYEGILFQILLRPMSYIYFGLWWKLGNRAFAFLIEIIPTLCVYLILFPSHYMVPAHPLAFVVSLVIAFLLYFCMNFLLGCTAFWLKKNTGLRWANIVLRPLLIGTLLPLSFYPEVVQNVLVFLPFQYLFYVPSTAFIGNYGLGSLGFTLWESLLFGAGYVIVGFLVTVWVWTKGVEKFEGVGV